MKRIKKRILGIAALCAAVSMTGCIFAKDVNTTDPIVLSADELAEKFKTDEDAAEKECRNTVYEITGVAHSVSSYNIQIQTDVVYEDSQCFMLDLTLDQNYKSMLPEELESGDTITIKARYEEYDNEEIELADAIYVSHQAREKYIIPTNTELEHGTNEYLDFLVLTAKDNAETVGDYMLQDAVEWLRDNAKNCFESTENMEKTMYFGALLKYKYEDSTFLTHYADAGWQALKTVKYVYRGAEAVTDEVTVINYEKLIELVSELPDLAY